MVIGCKNKLNDPLHGFIIDSEETIWKSNVVRLLNDHILFNEKDNGEFDSYLVLDKDSLPVKVYLNYDQYYFGKLIEYRISLNGDTNKSWNNTFYQKKGGGFQNFNTVKKAYKMIIEKYGIPDMTEPAIRYPTRDDVLRTLRGDTSTIVRNDIVLKSEGKNTVANSANFISTWDIGNYKIVFYSDPIEYLKDSVPRVANSYISFITRNYGSELKLIKDSLISTFTPGDYVEVSMRDVKINKIHRTYNQDFYDRELSVFFDWIRRGAHEDSRSVESFKYDVIFHDEYNTELLKMEGLNFTFLEPLKVNESNFYSMNGNTYGWSRQYNSSRTPDAKEIEKAYVNGFAISCTAVVKAVKLDDGTVIN